MTSAYLPFFKRFATKIDQLLGEETYRRIENEPWMPLSIERIGQSGDGNPLIAMSHTAVQNGDLMRDPEVVFELVTPTLAEPISYRQDYLGGAVREVYTYDQAGRRVGFRPQEKADLCRFCSVWFRNLAEQDFFEAAKRSAAA